MIEYPKWIYNETVKPVLVHSAEDEDQYDSSWWDNPTSEFNTRIKVDKEPVVPTVSPKGRTKKVV